MSYMNTIKVTEVYVLSAISPNHTPLIDFRRKLTQTFEINGWQQKAQILTILTTLQILLLLRSQSLLV
ncbi:hypothetical protein CANARDRAFT_176211 [[Candida] arabinofermentans NRRL YB-2248]|uniref:Uncharacterized protein n=1 Tax=[Candida] arabinofermentans NRRL YB-2248 TaxID=983967 RepID=A0A1E4T0N4_9ASCO|nr:hypothetical protein CANARDRAFT_176211 [[Candida] arabinofermentans NRRL YB-2248]